MPAHINDSSISQPAPTLTKASARDWSSPSKDKAATPRSSSRISKPRTAYRIKIMPRAQRDLSSLYDWIDASSSDAALTWYRPQGRHSHPAKQPQPCPVTPEDRDLRHLLYGSKPHVYRVIY